MSDKQTSWRKAFDSPYLASWDIDGEVTLTVGQVINEKNKMRKSVLHNVIHFQETELRKGEKLKPMILNATNCKMLHDMTGSIYIEGWAGHRVTIYVEENVKGADGTIGQGLRIKRPAALPILTANHPRFNGAVDAYKAGNIEVVKKHFQVSDEVLAMIEKASKVEAES